MFGRIQYTVHNLVTMLGFAYRNGVDHVILHHFLQKCFFTIFTKMV